MKSFTIDIINAKVMSILRELERLKLIRLRSGKPGDESNTSFAASFKGAMKPQPPEDIDVQLQSLRGGWE